MEFCSFYFEGRWGRREEEGKKIERYLGILYFNHNAEQSRQSIGLIGTGWYLLYPCLWYYWESYMLHFCLYHFEGKLLKLVTNYLPFSFISLRSLLRNVSI